MGAVRALCNRSHWPTVCLEFPLRWPGRKICGDNPDLVTPLPVPRRDSIRLTRHPTMTRKIGLSRDLPFPPKGRVELIIAPNRTPQLFTCVSGG